MRKPTIPERLRLLKLAAVAKRRARITGSRNAPWRRLLRAPRPMGELLLVPSDLRATDPSFADEVAAGQFGLAGAVVDLNGQSPFRLSAPSRAWARELHGFAWLGHLRAAGSDEATLLARRLVRDWIATSSRPRGLAWRPEVMAERVIAWIANAGLLLEGAEAGDFGAITRSLGAQIDLLDAVHAHAAPGAARLKCLIALVLADLALAGRDRHLARIEPRFLAELDRQILPDGGHVSRNPDTVLNLLLDLLPLRQCYPARQRPPPQALAEATGRMLRFLGALRLGDGSLARCNGRGADQGDVLATILSYNTDVGEAAGHLESSGYARLARGDTILLMDCGGPPEFELGGAAQAGCLAFEMSHVTTALLRNGGVPGDSHGSEKPAARATASHSTLCLDARSSASLVGSPAIERHCGGPVLRGPATVTARLTDADGACVIEASHDGYLAEFGLVHTRRLALSQDGLRLDGIDRLAPRSGVLRLPRDLPFAVHFHLAAQAEATCDAAGTSATFRVRGGDRWRLTVAGASASLEASIDYAHALGPQPRRQIVLRGACPGETTVTWSIVREAVAGA